jgi:hypothetical protein
MKILYIKKNIVYKEKIDKNINFLYDIKMDILLIDTNSLLREA